MKYIFLFYFFTLMFFPCFSQNHIISAYEKYDVNKEGLDYLKLLNLEGENPLILKVDSRKFIVYKNDNKIFKINIGYLSGDVVEIEKVKEDQLIVFKNVLDSLKIINPSVLNETKNEENNITVEDGTTYHLELFKDNYTIDYTTYAPEVYIENKFPFYKERIKFLKIIKATSELFSDEEYQKIEKNDTLYLAISPKEVSKLEKLKITKTSLDSNNLYTFTSLDDHILIISNKCIKNSIKSGEALKVGRNSFMTENENKIITLDFLDKYGLNLVLNKKKTVYLIDGNDLNKRTIILRKIVFR